MRAYEGSIWNLLIVQNASWEYTVVDSSEIYRVTLHVYWVRLVNFPMVSLDTLIGRPLTCQTFALIQLSSYGWALRIGLIKLKHSSDNTSMEEMLPDNNGVAGDIDYYISCVCVGM